MKFLQKLAKVFNGQGKTEDNADDLPAAWSKPLSDNAPCGPYLEYDADYTLLQAAAQPKQEVQYGQFIAAAQAPDWKAIESQSRQLLARSRDINLLVYLCRSRANLSGLEGLAEAMSLLAGLLRKWPEAMHPQRVIDGYEDPLVRSNALAGLADPEGLLKDMRSLMLSANTLTRLSMKDVEQAWAIPRMPGVMDPESVKRQLFDVFDKTPSLMQALYTLHESTQVIDDWAIKYLGDDAPDLSALLRLVAPYAQLIDEYVQRPPQQNGTRRGPHAPEPDAAQGITDVSLPAEAVNTPAPQHPTALVQVVAPQALSTNQDQMQTEMALQMLPAGSVREQREQVKVFIDRARQWYEENEPSSPVAVLLKQAHRMVGKRYAEVAQMIPMELLQKWDEEPEEPR